MSLKLYIGNYNYSSWSLRPWLVLRKAELPFETEVIDLDVNGYKEKLFSLTNQGTVPVLEINGNRIADSLAISEFCAKAVPNLWPKNSIDKAYFLNKKNPPSQVLLWFAGQLYRKARKKRSSPKRRCQT